MKYLHAVIQALVELVALQCINILEYKWLSKKNDIISGVFKSHREIVGQ